MIDLNSHLLRGMTPPREPYLVRVPVGAAAGFDSAFAALPSEVREATVTVETRKGDSAEGLGREMGVPGSAIAAFNPSMRRLKSGRLAPGQRLVVPTPAVVAAALDIPDPAIEKYPSSSPKLRVHTVRRGESLRAIARRYSISPERLMRINGLRKPVIFPGQTLLTAAPAKAKRGSTVRASARTKTASKGTAAPRSKSAGKARGSRKLGSSKARTSGKSSTAANSKSASRATPSAKTTETTRSTAKSSGASSKAGARTKR